VVVKKSTVTNAEEARNYLGKAVVKEMRMPLLKDQEAIFFKGCSIKNNLRGSIIQPKVIQEAVTKIGFYLNVIAQKAGNQMKAS